MRAVIERYNFTYDYNFFVTFPLSTLHYFLLSSHASSTFCPFPHIDFTTHNTLHIIRHRLATGAYDVVTTPARLSIIKVTHTLTTNQTSFLFHYFFPHTNNTKNGPMTNVQSEKSWFSLTVFENMMYSVRRLTSLNCVAHTSVLAKLKVNKAFPIVTSNPFRGSTNGSSFI